MSTWQEDLKEDKKLMRELHSYSLSSIRGKIEIVRLINEFDRASSDIHKLEVAGKIINLIQKVV